MSLIRRCRPFVLPNSHRYLVLGHNVRQYTAQATPSTSSTHPHTHPHQSTSSQPSSVSADEVKHFSALASSWWDPHGSSRLLHQMNPLRHDFIRKCMSSSSTPSSIDLWQPQTSSSDSISDADEKGSKLTYLDIGCGGGIFAESAARLPSTESVIAIDPTPECIAVAKAHQRTDPALLVPGKLTYLNTSIESLSLSPSSTTAKTNSSATPRQYPRERTDQGADIVTLFEVIEHIRDPTPFLSDCLNHVRPGGWFIGSTISRTLTSWFTTKLVAEDLLGIVPRGTHDWNQYINVDEMRRWAERQSDFAEFTAMGVVYVPGFGWKEVGGSESWGNYFFALKRLG